MTLRVRLSEATALRITVWRRTGQGAQAKLDRIGGATRVEAPGGTSHYPLGRVRTLRTLRPGRYILAVRPVGDTAGFLTKTVGFRVGR